ncbi:MAG: hypothetical protein HYW86_04040 [Candidatus Roizmanbacteria bacterium]|nr:MAG: hypothetical protein HYW86_04040 [Candidatus Roizmanbacteria bacterium]
MITTYQHLVCVAAKGDVLAEEILKYLKGSFKIAVRLIDPNHEKAGPLEIVIFQPEEGWPGKNTFTCTAFYQLEESTPQWAADSLFPVAVRFPFGTNKIREKLWYATVNVVRQIELWICSDRPVDTTPWVGSPKELSEDVKGKITVWRAQIDGIMSQITIMPIPDFHPVKEPKYSRKRSLASLIT